MNNEERKKKNNEDLVFTNAGEFQGFDPKNVSPLSLTEVVANAINEAILNKISANAIIINNKYAKTERILYNFGSDIYEVPPMLCGLYLEFLDLPKEFAFAITKIPKPDFYMKINEAEHRAEVAERALNCLARSFAEAMCKYGDDTHYLVDGFIQDAYRQAEKELAEEGKE